MTFTTPGPPLVATNAASAVTTTGATLNGSVDPTGLATTYWFQWGATTGYGNETPHSVGGSSAGAVPRAAALTGLAAGATYHYRVVAANSEGTTFGNDVTFTTAVPPATSSGVTQPHALALTLKLVKSSLRGVLAKGLRLRGNCGEACSITFKLSLSARDARRLHLPRTLAITKGKSGAAVRLRPSTKAVRALRRVRSIKLKLSATAIAPDRRRATLSKSVTLRR
jgi:hypothetical protein